MRAFLCGLLLCVSLSAWPGESTSPLGSDPAPGSVGNSSTPRTISPQPETTLSKYRLLVTELKDSLASLRTHIEELQTQLSASETILTGLRQSLTDLKISEQSLSARLDQAVAAVDRAQASARRSFLVWLAVSVGAGLAGLLAGLLIG